MWPGQGLSVMGTGRVMLGRMRTRMRRLRIVDDYERRLYYQI
jgi:hypothetical protein